MMPIHPMMIQCLFRAALTGMIRLLGIALLGIVLPEYLSGQVLPPSSSPSPLSKENRDSLETNEQLWGEEIRSARTLNSKTYASANGLDFTTVVSSGYVHYEDEGGELQEIDRRLTKSLDGNGYEVRKGLYHASFKFDLKSAGYPVRFEMRDSTSFSLQPKALGYFDRASKRLVILEEAASSLGVITLNRIRYSQLFSGVDVEYEYGDVKLKEYVYVSQKARELLPDPKEVGLNSNHTYLVLVARYEAADSLDAFAENVQVSVRGQSGKLKITYEGEDALEFRGRSGKTKFKLSRDVAYVEADRDSLDRPAPVFEVMTRRFYEENEESYVLSGVALNWLEEQPAGTVVFDPTVKLMSAFADGYIYAAYPTTNYGSDAYLYVGNVSGVQRTLIKFDLSAIPKNAVVIASTLKLYYAGATYGPYSRVIQCHEMLQGWGEEYASWHYRGPGDTWIVDGVGLNNTDAKSTPEASRTWYEPWDVWKNYTLTALTQRWVSGASVNNGILLWATNETSGAPEAKRIFSSEYTTDTTKRPRLLINYRLDPMVEYQYTAEGQPWIVTYANGVTEINDYNPARDWITRRDYQKADGSNVFYFENSVYDNVGNVKHQNYKQLVETIRQMDYDYDDLYRIETFKYGGVTKQTYTYDDNGNFKTFGSRTFAYTTGSNRLVNDAVRSYTFDNSGRVKQIASTAMTYDVFNNMRTYGTDSYSYDAENTRIKKTEAGVTTYYITDGLNVLAEYNGNGKLIAEYIHDDRGLVAKYDSTRGHFWFYKDHLGNTRRVEPTATRRDYWPFGEAYTASGSETNYLFTGKELDNTSGLYYFGARYYDPRIGRWTSVDPSAYLFPWTSPYAYANNNPLAAIDPNGKEWYLTTYEETITTVDDSGRTQTKTVTRQRWQWFPNAQMEIWTGEYDSQGNKIFETRRGENSFILDDPEGGFFEFWPNGTIRRQEEIVFGIMPLGPGRFFATKGFGNTWNYWRHINAGAQILKQSSTAQRAAYDAWKAAGGAGEMANQAQRVARAGSVVEWIQKYPQSFIAGMNAEQPPPNGNKFAWALGFYIGNLR